MPNRLGLCDRCGGGRPSPMQHERSKKPRTTPRPIALADVRKVPAETVPYGTDISLNGRTVWAAFHEDRVVAVAASAKEARRKYVDWQRRNQAASA
jgi:hypothetical protein